MLVLVTLLAVAGLAAAGLGGPRATTQDDQVRAVATTLRCPVCAGEDVADSAAPLAESMRLVIAEQLDEGRSPAQIRGWFAQTYGDDVLLAPPARGAGWVMWAVPLLVLVGAGVLLARRWRRGRWPVVAGVAAAVVLVGVWAVPSMLDHRVGLRWGEVPDGGPGLQGSPLAVDAQAPVSVLQAGVAELPGSAPLRATLATRLEEAGDYEQAAQEYAVLVRLRPLDPDVRYREAFALVRAGDQDAARASLQLALDLRQDHPEALLLLGTLEQERDPAEGVRLLSRFLEVAPEHPQADQVRDWLEQQGSP